MRMQKEGGRYGDTVATAMSTKLQTMTPNASIDELRDVLDSGLVAIVADSAGFHGLITRFDLLNHLRKTRR
jgi:cystathionine beta-synthase